MDEKTVLPTTESYRRQTARSRARTRFVTGLALLAVLAAAFFLRAAAYGLPSLDPRERPYMQDEAGEQYLTEMDSYFYLRKAQEMADAGKVSWTVDRTQDPLMGPRTRERPAESVMPLGLSALTYLIWRYVLRAGGVSLTQTAIWMGPVLGSLAAIPAFRYVRKRTSLPGGIAAGLLTGCTVSFVSHTHAGFFDTDMVLALLPMAGMFSLMRCMGEPDRKRRILFALSGAAAFAALSLFWSVWYSYYLLALAGAALSLLLIRLFPLFRTGGPPREAVRPALRGALLFLLFSVILLLLTGGATTVRQLVSARRQYRSLMGSTDSMPYVLAHTVEMQTLPFLPGGALRDLLKGDLRSVLGRLGGLIPCVLAAAYLPLRLLTLRSERGDAGEAAGKEPAALAMEAGFLGVWTAAGLVLVGTGVRFSRIAVLPVCVLAGLTAGWLFSLAMRADRRRRIPAGILCALVILAAVFPSAYASRKAARQASTLVTDSKDAAMAFVRDAAPEDAAIVSWWDDGYFLEYRSGRRTLADGGISDGKTAWLLGKALLTDDPALMAGICRMLSESGADALDVLTEAGLSQADAAGLLLRLLPLSRAEADAVLRERGLPPSLLDKTHPLRAGPVLLSLSTDLLGKIRAISYFAFWDPETKTAPSVSPIVFSLSSAEMCGGAAEIPMRGGRTVYLREDAQGRLRAEYSGPEGERAVPSRLCVWEEGNRRQDDRVDNGALAAVVVKENGRCCALLCEEVLCDSMLVRMMVCEDVTMAQAVRLGTWYADTQSESMAAQRRSDYSIRSSRASQVWEIRVSDAPA
ncbi:MAG: hypothetical protein IJH47_10300 [Oscillospiraceae bacterium]|nr:hypothetical protein [Oscillospiraceae bacterium]